MNKKHSISKLFVGVFFLTIYCNVLFTQYKCNTSSFLEVSEQHHHSDDHQHAHNSAPLAEHSHHDSNKHTNSKDDNCCNDKTLAFFASQNNLTNSSFEFKNICFHTVISFFNRININNPSLVNSKGYIFYESPPPKIPDIRVFIHSFLI